MPRITGVHTILKWSAEDLDEEVDSACSTFAGCEVEVLHIKCEYHPVSGEWVAFITIGERDPA